MKSFLKKNHLQIIRFLIVGLISNALNFGVYSLIYLLTLQINLASFSGYLVGLINSFLFSKIWVFRNSKRISLSKAFFLFTIIYWVGGIEMILIINFMNNATGNFRIAWFFGALFAALSNFLGSKYILFKS